MCTVLQSYLQKGLAQGREEGRIEILTKMIKKDMPDDFIFSLGYTVEEIKAAKEIIMQEA